MSDKDDSVEMSEELTAEDTPAKENILPPAESADNEAQNTGDSFSTAENVDEGEMGQIKSKVKKLREKRKGEKDDEDAEVEIAEPDGGFMCGVVEGFYGRPWTTGQRRELFRRMKAMGMNTYLYGPKDDYKHRLYWRDLYSTDETNLLKLLIDASIEHDVLFIYAISPGLDMSFASPKELECLKNKLLQVQSLGCKAFALLFDDIDPILCAADKAQYKSAASAQAGVTNQMYDVLGGPRFLFCPTEYCSSMAIPDVPNSRYLATIGKELNKNISIMWTGPKVVSKYITVESIKQLTRILRRKVVIWDNIHANDYDPKRMFLGPYKGRSTALIPHLAGVLTNPNCEFESNYIAMHTLAAWWKSFLKHEEKLKEPLRPPGEDAEDEHKKLDVEMESDDREEAAFTKTCEESTELKIKAELSDNKEEGGIVLGPQSPHKVGETAEVKLPTDNEAKGDRDKLEEEITGIEKEPKPKNSDNEVPQSSLKASEVNSTNQPGSSSSSLVGSDDSDTDSDYSSHEDYYVLSRHSATPPFDHGVYNPDESLKEAVRSWLPYFFTSCLPHGKPIARSGPPLGMLSHCDMGLVSSAPMGLMSSTTSALTSDPILCTNFPASESHDDKRINVQTEHLDHGKDENDAKQEGVDVEVGVQRQEETGEKAMEEPDVEMAGATPAASASSVQVAVADNKIEPEDVKMRSDSDIDMNPPTTSPDSEKKRMSDSEDVEVKKVESTIQMETEEEEPMQLEPDQASDVSMATTQSSDEKKVSKPEEDETEMNGESSVGMMTPPNQTSSPSPTPEPEDEADEQRSCEEHETPHQFKIEPMTREDVELAVELFYLPYEHGNFGRRMVQEFVWLQNNIRQAVMPPNAPDSVKSESMDKALEWMERAIQFEDSCSSIRRMCNKLISCSNRALLYDLFPYFWDMKGVVSMLSSYVKWMGQFYLRHQPAISPEPSETGSNSSKPASPASSPSPDSSPIAVSSSQMPPLPPAAAWLGNDPEPWVFRGGLSGEFQRLLPIAMANDLFCHAIPCSPPASNTTYTIRPYLASDEKAAYNICLTTGNDGTDFADDFSGYEDLPGERLVGGLLALSPEYCFVVEDDLGICGYLVGTADSKSFWKKHSIAFWPDVKKKYLPTENEPKVGEEVKRLLDEIRSDDSPDSYAVDNLYSSHPAYMQIAVHRRVTDPSIAKSMTVCMLSALKSHGIHGVHTTVRSSDCYMPDLYCRLGFREIRPFELSPTVPSPRSLSNKEDTFIVFGRTF